jgi:hypothetical protein
MQYVKSLRLIRCQLSAPTLDRGEITSRTPHGRPFRQKIPGDRGAQSATGAEHQGLSVGKVQIQAPNSFKRRD